MNWDAFFLRTCEAAGVSTNAELAPKLGLTPAAVSHYRTGKRTPPAWIVHECLVLQGDDDPERETARIMLEFAHTKQERAWWRRLAAAAAIATVAICLPIGRAEAQGFGHAEPPQIGGIMRS